MRERSFWLVSAGHGMALVSVFTVIVHLVPHLVEERGWSETSAQWMFAVVSVTSILGQVARSCLKLSRIWPARSCPPMVLPSPRISRETESRE